MSGLVGTSASFSHACVASRKHFSVGKSCSFRNRYWHAGSITTASSALTRGFAKSVDSGDFGIGPNVTFIGFSKSLDAWMTYSMDSGLHQFSDSQFLLLICGPHMAKRRASLPGLIGKGLAL